MLPNLPKRDTKMILPLVGPGKRFIYDAPPVKKYNVKSFQLRSINIKPKYNVVKFELRKNLAPLHGAKLKVTEFPIKNVRNDSSKTLFGVDNTYVDNKYNINHSYYELGLKGHTKDEVLLAHIQGSNKFKPKMPVPDDKEYYQQSKEDFMKKFNEQYRLKIKQPISPSEPVKTVEVEPVKIMPAFTEPKKTESYLDEDIKFQQRMKKRAESHREQLETSKMEKEDKDVGIVLEDNKKLLKRPAHLKEIREQEVINSLLKKIDESDESDEDDEYDDNDDKSPKTKEQKKAEKEKIENDFKTFLNQNDDQTIKANILSLSDTDLKKRFGNYLTKESVLIIAKAFGIDMVNKKFATNHLKHKKSFIRGEIQKLRPKTTITESNVKKHNDVNHGISEPEKLPFPTRRDMFDTKTDSEAGTIRRARSK